MVYILLNFGQILTAMLAGLAFGILLHALVGRDPDRPYAMLLTAAVAEFWLCAILAGGLILAPVKVDPWIVALMTAFVIWVGFVLPALAVTLRYRALGWRTVALDCAHWLAVMLIQAAVLHALGLTRP